MCTYGVATINGNKLKYSIIDTINIIISNSNNKIVLAILNQWKFKTFVFHTFSFSSSRQY